MLIVSLAKWFQEGMEVSFPGLARMTEWFSLSALSDRADSDRNNDWEVCEDYAVICNYPP